MIKKLKQLGYHIIVIAPKDTFSSKLISEGVSYKNIAIYNYSTNPIGELATINRFRKLYKQNKIDFIFHYTIKPNIYGSLAAWLCGIPSIAITTGLGHFLNYKNPIVKTLTTSLYRLGAAVSKEVWFLNEDDKNTFLKKRIVSKEKAKLLPSEGINTDWFSPNGYIKKTTDLTFLYAGRVLWDKGVREFAEAAKFIRNKYKNIHFKILGFVDPNNPNSVPYDEILKWQRENIISYAGETTDVRPFIERSDCLIFPSFYREGVSRILLEAAAMAKPIITTDNVGCREVVDDGLSGYLVEPKNTQDLIQKIEQFIQLPDTEKQQMGQRGRSKVQQLFDEKKVIEYYVSTLQKYKPLLTQPNKS